MSGVVANDRYIRKDQGDINFNGLRSYDVVSYTNHFQLMSGLVANSRYLRKDSGDINLNGLRLYDVGSFTSADQLITGLALRQKSYSSYIFGEVKGNTFSVSNHSLFLDNIWLESIELINGLKYNNSNDTLKITQISGRRVLYFRFRFNMGETIIHINRETEFTLIQLQTARDILYRLKYKTVNI